VIINLRGTHGAGKTTIVRKVMALYPICKPLYIDRRKRPIGYLCRNKKKRLFVPGAYDNASPTGGCDTIPVLNDIYKAIRKYAKKEYDVLYEGIVAQHSTPNVVRLTEMGYDVSIVVIDIPLKKSIRGVKRRRKKRKETRVFNPLNMTNEARAVLNTAGRLRVMGLYVAYPKTRRAAFQRTLKLLGIAV
jgi:hypothetical protein